MWYVFRVNLKGVFRDRVFQGILVAAVLFLIIPSVSSLSMRQGFQLAMTLSLSSVTFILLLLAVFLGGTSLWKDIDRRYTYNVASLPLSRHRYLLGKFFAVAVFLLLVSLVLGVLAYLAVYVTSLVYPSQKSVIWGNLALAVFFHCLKYILLVAFAFMFSTVSTSFFLPIFGTIAVFLAGMASQQVYDFLQTPTSQKLPLLIRQVAEALYYVVPNFSAFNLNVNAVYSLPVSGGGVLLTLAYFFVYLLIVLAFSGYLFSKREFQ